MHISRIKSSIAKIFKTKKLRRGLLGYILVIVGISFILAIPLKERFNGQTKVVESVSEGQDYDHGPIQADPELLNGQYQESLLPMQVVIPSAGIDVPLRAAKVVKGKWEVFEDVGSFGLGSAEPGKKGNTVIFAHARIGLFLPLREVKVGDRVYITTQEKWYSYEVKEIKEVLPDDISVISPTEDETLTLYTCSGFSDSKRLIVTAKRT